VKGVFLVADQPVEKGGLTEWVVADLLALCAGNADRVVVVAGRESLHCFAYALEALDPHHEAEPTRREKQHQVTFLVTPSDDRISNEDTGGEDGAPEFRRVDSVAAWSDGAWRRELERCNAWAGIVLGNPRFSVAKEVMDLLPTAAVYQLPRLSQLDGIPFAHDGQVDLDALVAWSGFAGQARAVGQPPRGKATVAK
jgi:hypothetical protein